ncbi:hypothetical protein OPV22_014396 [Ensete ventricosum]|uniref:Uncharacterized protein n=1 Tax=Ensete ventricosum TaxID=4639 RepID=A0AAV8R1I3_ENSVE|nr:hypothetical protein OPV22_014396 [Ensete ventricosum]
MEVSIWRRIKGSLFYMISSGNLNPVADPMKKKSPIPTLLTLVFPRLASDGPRSCMITTYFWLGPALKTTLMLYLSLTSDE